MKNVKCFIENYPRMNFVNPKWMSLNGKWNFDFDDEDNKDYKNGFTDKLTINVPFSFQTKASGIMDPNNHNVIWYSQTFDFSNFDLSNRLILNFDGVDYETYVYVNGKFVGKHIGGYTRFSFDISDYVKENIKECLIVLKVIDYKEAIQPRGKQTWLENPFGCWYKETNGIWKSVWVEEVPVIHLENVKITPCLDEYYTEFEIELNKYVEGYDLDIEVSFNDKLINKTKVSLLRRVSNIKVDMNNDYDGFRVHYWTPGCPNLYDVKFTLMKDDKPLYEIGSYFGFRQFRAEKNLLVLNNDPIYLKMVLYQGYHADSGLSAPNFDALKQDVMLCKELGLNGIRMHQKIEEDYFYYLCDVYGLLVWCEMPSAYELKDNTITSVTKEWMDVVREFYNHPAIVVWVPINESWGVPRIVQDKTNMQFAEALYHITKAYDKYRPVISNDGWEQVSSDIVTLHNYTQDPKELKHIYGDMEKFLSGKNFTVYSQTRLPFANGYEYKGQPVVLSEFAGIGYKNGNQDGWGYGKKVNSDEAYVNRLVSLIEEVLKNDEICGYCITQLTDVEIEINGLYDINRKPKANLEKIKEIIGG